MWTNIRFSRLLFALALGAAVAMGLASGMAYSADGDLDLTLDSDGLVTTNFNNTLDEARAVVRHSFKPETFKPCPANEWDAAYQKLNELVRI